MEGHHGYNAADYLYVADNPKYIRFVTKIEHLFREHGGDFHNSTSGSPLNPSFKEEF